MKYEDAGVNISKADAFVEKIKSLGTGNAKRFCFGRHWPLRFFGGAERLQEPCFGFWY